MSASKLREQIDSTGEQAVSLARQALARDQLPNRPQTLVFLALSGAHIYGFPSPDSDLDLRGAHLLPLAQVVGLHPVRETYELIGTWVEGVELDCVTHDLGKYLRLLTGRNGYILEQIFSPLVVHDSGCLQELRELATCAMTRHLVHHYKGFFRSQEKQIAKARQTTVKSILYLFRVAMTGLCLLRSHEVETDILRLNEAMFNLPLIEELVERKLGGKEKSCLGTGESDSLIDQARQLADQLDDAAAASGLPEAPANKAAINDFLVRMRLDQPVVEIT
jgi:predicted nucleotidyltransferase